MFLFSSARPWLRLGLCFGQVRVCSRCWLLAAAAPSSRGCIGPLVQVALVATRQ